MAKLLSTTYRSVKRPNPPKLSTTPPSSSSLPLPKSKSQAITTPRSSRARSWSVYLILSTNLPIKTYVGVTTDFSRRLRQHNGELKGGAKASRAGRPWVCACIIQGFKDNSEACEFESKWKSFSRKLPRKRKRDNMEEEVDNGSLPLLQHRKVALDRVKASLECSQLEFDWQLNP